jgi:dTDP-4-dehydrorhamnose reductase
MRILITGGKGMLGRTLLRHWEKDHTCTIADLPETDLTNPQAIEECFTTTQPEVVVHCAAMTQVDQCELNPNRAFLLNETVTANIARATNACGARLIAISTDYVFSGDHTSERKETDPTNPLTVYGASKLAGEKAIRELCPNHIIARVAWLYGAGGPSFVHTMMALAVADPLRAISVVDDQYGNPTSTDAVAKLLTAILNRPELMGTFHLTCEGVATWYEFSKTIFRLAGYTDLTVTPCSTKEFPRPAKRPHYSALSKAKLKVNGLPKMPQWQEELARFIRQEWH